MRAEDRDRGPARPGVLEAAAFEARSGEVDLPPDALLNMELSVLAFNRRVLELAMDPGTPLLERVRFIAILGSNLDEFFMTRVAGFKRQLALGHGKRTLDGRTPQEQLDMIGVVARELLRDAYETVIPRLFAELAAQGIQVLSWTELAPEEKAYLDRNYTSELDAVINPVPLLRGGRFPHVRNLRPALLVRSGGGNGAEPRLLIVELPGDVPRLVPLPGGRRFIPLEEVLGINLPRLLDIPEPPEAYLFRVTRSGNLSLEGEEINDLVNAVAENLARRPFQPVVRLEVEASMPEDLRAQLLSELGIEAETRLSVLGEDDVYTVDGLIDLHGLNGLASLPIPELRYPRQRRTSPVRSKPSIFDQIEHGDILVRFPFDSFEKTVERFVYEAATDPQVRSIAITLYRTNRASRIVRLLRRAHRNGKKVVALIEVKASFDERRNIEWARALESAGIRVLYGPPSLKVHAKIARVVREAEGEERSYCYISTGNLNAATAAAYTDLGIFTADPVVGSEMQTLFAVMGGEQTIPAFERLVVAPFNMRQRFLDLVEREIQHAREGRGGEITIKMNGLADREMIAALYQASRAGVKVDLIIRGICSLRPGVFDLSENIRIVSIVGRYLEHTRIFRFTNGGAPEHYIGSADWRGRNLSRRVEVLIRVQSSAHRDLLDRILADDFHSPDAWEMAPDGSYKRREGRGVR